MRTVALVARKEMKELVRDGRFRVAGALVLLLLMTALAFGWQQASTLAAERAAAQHVAEEDWKGQGDKNPHVATHYGKYVFKPVGALAFLDPGADPYLGVTLKLQAHQQNLPQDAAARDQASISRFGQLSAATVLQLFVPLLIIALGFGAFSGERERGTLRQVASTGVRPTQLLAGKALGLAAVLGMLLIPAAVVAAVVTLQADGAHDATGGEVGGRLGMMALAYLVYFGAFAGVTFLISARAPSSRFALVALVGFWSLTSLVVPRIAGDVAVRVVPLPTPAEFTQAVRASLEGGLPGSAPREDRVDEISSAMLDKAGFSGAETLMDESALQGIELQAEAAFEDEVYDHHIGQLMEAMARQERAAQWAALASPLLAIRTVSASLAGTDFAHHRAFQVDAERYRKALVQAMNDDFAQNAGTAGWDYKAGREVWEKAPTFEHQPPGLGWALSEQALGWALLGLWLGLAWAAAAWAAARVRVF